MQNAAVSIVFELIERIDAAQQRNALQRAVAGDDLGGQLLARFQIALQSAYGYRLVTLHSDRLPGRAIFEGQWQHTHADQIGAVDTLEALANHGADTEQPRSLRGPIARRAITIFGAGKNHQRDLLGLILHRGIVDRHLLAVGPVPGQAALGNIAVGALQYEVLDTDVGESAAHHD